MIGIDKTLKLIKLLDTTLLCAEQLLRNEGALGVDKTSLPMLKIAEPLWRKARHLPGMLIDWDTCRSKATKSKGRNLTEEEEIDLYQDWHEANTYYPGQDESDRFNSALEDFELRQKEKGKGPKSKHRPSLSKWMISAKTFKLFCSGPLDNDTERPKKDRIIAHSRALGDALKVISGELRALPSRYPKTIERHLKGGARETLREIIRHSVELPKLRKSRIALWINEREAELKAIEKKRKDLLAHIKRLKGIREKMG